MVADVLGGANRETGLSGIVPNTILPLVFCLRRPPVGRKPQCIHRTRRQHARPLHAIPT